MSYSYSSSTKVMAFGHSFGCGFIDSHRAAPSEIIFEGVRENFVSISAGQMRSIATTESGKIFAWGEWFTGTKQSKPKEILMPKGHSAKKICSGKMFCLILSGLGKVFAIGDNTYGELGLSREIKNSFEPCLIESLQTMNIVDIAVGARHSLALSSDGKLLSFGDNSEGQCGIEEIRAYNPTEIPLKTILTKTKPERIFCGEAHSAMVTDDGELFMWGDNTAGRLGIKGAMSIFRPRIVEDVMGKYISCVGCGGLFTAILVGPGKFNILAKSHNSENLIPPN